MARARRAGGSRTARGGPTAPRASWRRTCSTPWSSATATSPSRASPPSPTDLDDPWLPHQSISVTRFREGGGVRFQLSQPLVPEQTNG
ncbi:unnamed protein product [Triticum turgidum subsp. durum]|uniref:Uncharacterized protein n=1 Tax=Triticum turgidum subsp. durum TaxID=4567 RepID=A0A9R1AEZ0_TRITD|nr:unnamed protein product [Triticum turgidum subsp. durum]